MNLIDAQGRIRTGAVIAGRYEVIKPLADGGFATVYSAQQVPIRRVVALKVLEGVTAPTEAELYRKRFLREAKLLASLNHPHIVRIYDYGIVAEIGRPFIAMEMLEGRDLQDQLLYGGLDPDRGLKLILQALDALAYAHKQGIVHRDLKPSNLFVVHPRMQDERCKVLDFGLARTDDPDASKLSRTGTMIGTPQYLAPEMIEGRPVGASADVYQMGLILAETLTGRRVVDAPNRIDCCVKHLKRDFKIPSQLLEGPIGPVVEKALAFDPEQRFADANEMRDALVQVDGAEFRVAATFESFRRLDVALGDASVSTEEVLEPTTLPQGVAPDTLEDPADSVPTIPEGVHKPITRVHTAERSLVGHVVGSNIVPKILRPKAGGNKGSSAWIVLGAVGISVVLLVLGVGAMLVAWVLTR